MAYFSPSLLHVVVQISYAPVFMSDVFRSLMSELYFPFCLGSKATLSANSYSNRKF